MDVAVSQAIERAARNSYGKLVAVLAARSRNIASAEDALSGALLKALKDWPGSGVPKNPEAWLLTTARRIDIDAWQRAMTAHNQTSFVTMIENERMEIVPDEIPDDRLRLLFACAHPAIDQALHMPLMLQVVLGVSAHKIASALLLPPVTIGQRLSRAKAKIKDAGLRFSIPEAVELPARVAAVLNATYVAYTLGNEAAFGENEHLRDLAMEAIWLARVIVSLLPEDQEAKGLLALMLFSEARRVARRFPTKGDYIPLSDQNISLWNIEMIDEAKQLLQQSRNLKTVGRFGLEAAIQSVHTERRVSGTTDWIAIEHLYRGLIAVSPTIGAQIGHAITASHCFGPSEGLELLYAISTDKVANYASYWAARAHLNSRLGHVETALDAYHRAIGLTEDAAVRLYLIGKRKELLAA